MIFDYYIVNVVHVEFNFHLNLKYWRHGNPLLDLGLNGVSHLKVQFNFFLSHSINLGRLVKSISTSEIYKSSLGCLTIKCCVIKGNKIK